MRALLPLAVAALAGSVVACGGEPEDRFALRTPPVRSSATPLPQVERAGRQAERDARLRPTRRDAVRLRPVLAGWGEALTRDDDERAARYFAVPAIVAQTTVVALDTAAEVKQFNHALPCGARLLRVRQSGRFLVGTFELTKRPQHNCLNPGDRLRIAFVLRDRKIAEWRAVAKGAEPGPARPEIAPDPPLENVS
jgi:hypothetical protein